MLIRIFSDLHIHRKDEFKYEPKDEDVVVIAGDVSEGKSCIDLILNMNIQVPVIFVPGNHEFYGTNYQDMRSFFDGIKFEEYGIHVLQEKEVVINGVTFCGTTLWTGFNCFVDEIMNIRSVMACKQYMNDYFYINFNGRTMVPGDSMNLHTQAVEYLASIKPVTEKSVLITHHCANWSVPTRFSNDPINGGYTAKVPMEIVDKFDLWIHGHTHDVFDYRIYNEKETRIVCNPKGYHSENINEFVQEKVVEL